MDLRQKLQMRIGLFAVLLALSGARSPNSAAQQQPPQPMLAVTPTAVVLAVGQTAELSAIDQSGRAVRNAQWSVEYPIAATAATDTGIQLTGLRRGRALLTASVGNLSASAMVSVVEENQLPAITVRWSLDPTPGYNTLELRRGQPMSASDPDLFSIEWSRSARTMIRAIRDDGAMMANSYGARISMSLLVLAL